MRCSCPRVRGRGRCPGHGRRGQRGRVLRGPQASERAGHRRHRRSAPLRGGGRALGRPARSRCRRLGHGRGHVEGDLGAGLHLAGDGIDLVHPDLIVARPDAAPDGEGHAPVGAGAAGRHQGVVEIEPHGGPGRGLARDVEPSALFRLDADDLHRPGAVRVGLGGVGLAVAGLRRRILGCAAVGHGRCDAAVGLAGPAGPGLIRQMFPRGALVRVRLVRNDLAGIRIPEFGLAGLDLAGLAFAGRGLPRPGPGGICEAGPRRRRSRVRLREHDGGLVGGGQGDQGLGIAMGRDHHRHAVAGDPGLTVGAEHPQGDLTVAGGQGRRHDGELAGRVDERTGNRLVVAQQLDGGVGRGPPGDHRLAVGLDPDDVEGRRLAARRGARGLRRRLARLQGRQGLSRRCRPLPGARILPDRWMRLGWGVGSGGGLADGRSALFGGAGARRGSEAALEQGACAVEGDHEGKARQKPYAGEEDAPSQLRPHDTPLLRPPARRPKFHRRGTGPVDKPAIDGDILANMIGSPNHTRRITAGSSVKSAVWPVDRGVRVPAAAHQGGPAWRR